MSIPDETTDRTLYACQGCGLEVGEGEQERERCPDCGGELDPIGTVEEATAAGTIMMTTITPVSAATTIHTIIERLEDAGYAVTRVPDEQALIHVRDGDPSLHGAAVRLVPLTPGARTDGLGWDEEAGRWTGVAEMQNGIEVGHGSRAAAEDLAVSVAADVARRLGAGDVARGEGWAWRV